MSAKSPIPPEFVDYVRNPLAEHLTVELFEDLHHVLDQYIVEVVRKEEPHLGDHEIIRDWEAAHKDTVDESSASVQQRFGALLPAAFIAGNEKFRFLAQSGHPAFQEGGVPEDVAEVMQEFVELITYRDEYES